MAKNQVEAQVNALRELRQLLRFSVEVTYDSGGGCLPGKRSSLLREIECWSLNSTGGESNCHMYGNDREEELYRGMLKKRIVWLYGPAGSGKSAVANSVADFNRGQGLYLASFCCKRDKQEDLSSSLFLSLPLAHSQSQHVHPRWPETAYLGTRVKPSADEKDCIPADLTPLLLSLSPSLLPLARVHITNIFFDEDYIKLLRRCQRNLD